MAKAKEPTLTDFVEWCKRQIEPHEISSVLASNGYTDDNTETVVAALENNPGFRSQFGKVLRDSLSKNKSYYDDVRAAGDVSINDWIQAAKASYRPKLARATGATKAKQWWEVLLDTVGVIAKDTLVGGSSSNELTPEQIAAAKKKAEDDAKAAAAKQTFLYIVLGVVVVAVVAILWMSTKKK